MKIVHICNAYCHDGIHARVIYTDCEWSTEDVILNLDRSFELRGLQHKVVSVFPAPEAPGPSADQMYVQYSTARDSVKTLRVRDTNDIPRYPWLLLYRDLGETV